MDDDCACHLALDADENYYLDVRCPRAADLRAIEEPDDDIWAEYDKHVAAATIRLFTELYL